MSFCDPFQNLTSSNLKRFYEAAMPPDDLNALFNQGYEQTDSFLNSSKFKSILTNLPLTSKHSETQENHAEETSKK